MEKLKELENKVIALEKENAELKKSVHMLSEGSELLKHVAKKYEFAVCKNCESTFVRNTKSQIFCTRRCNFDYQERQRGK